MDTYESKYYTMEFVEEEDKIVIQFYNDRNELVATKDMPKDTTIEAYIERNRQN